MFITGFLGNWSNSFQEKCTISVFAKRCLSLTSHQQAFTKALSIIRNLPASAVQSLLCLQNAICTPESGTDILIHSIIDVDAKSNNFILRLDNDVESLLTAMIVVSENDPKRSTRICTDSKAFLKNLFGSIKPSKHNFELCF
jgi:hypothetical protein